MLIQKLGRVIALTWLAVVLGAALSGEYLALRSEHNEPDSSPTRRSPMTLVQSQAPAGPNIQAEVDTILARPMFSQSRRPPPIRAFAPAALPRLTGVLIGGQSKTAIFSGGAGTKSIALVEGDLIGRYVIQFIVAG